MAEMARMSEMSMDYIRAARHAAIHPVFEMSEMPEMPNMTAMLKHVLGRALESQRTKGDCREAMKTKGKFRFSATHSNLTTLQTNTNAAQAVRSITLAQ
jgi:hypothetical protein